MKKTVVFSSMVLLVLALVLQLFSCSKSGKIDLANLKLLEHNVARPTSTEDLEKAIKEYEKDADTVMAKHSKAGMWYKMLATRYLDKKMYALALGAFQNAIEYYPENQTLFYYSGLCAGFMANSALDFDASGERPTAKKYYYLLLAEESYLRAIALDEKYGNALYGLGVLYVFELDKNEEAIPYLERYLDIHKSNIDAFFVLARAYYATYQFDKAVQMYDKIFASNPSPAQRAEAESNKSMVLDTAFRFED
ncbi:MAG: tetratricopeptide repeat protein [Treponemataceae bacterium]|nr:MAG: tetratricopeptide repeat protein [Treponemataceae bacterium]